LLRLLAGGEQPHAGTMRLDPPGATVGYLPRSTSDGPVKRSVPRWRAAPGVTAAESELAHAGEALGRGEAGAEERFAVALERYEGLAAGDIEARMRAPWRPRSLR